MGKGGDKRRRNAKNLGQRTKEEERIVRALEAEDARIRSKYARKHIGTRPPSEPPVIGESDAPVRAPLKPKPYLRSGAIALPEPELAELFVVTPRRAGRNVL